MGDDVRYAQKGIWVMENGHPTRIEVKSGVYDDNNTQIEGDKLSEGMEVIIENADNSTRGGRNMPMRIR